MPIFFLVRSAITIGARYIGAPLVLADYKEDERVQSASPIFMLIANYLGFTNRKRKYFEEKTTATLKSKQTSIATVRYHLLPVASLLTPLIFHHPLPLKLPKIGKTLTNECDIRLSLKKKAFWSLALCLNGKVFSSCFLNDSGRNCLLEPVNIWFGKKDKVAKFLLMIFP